MKKILSILAAIGLAATSAASVVACSKSHASKKENSNNNNNNHDGKNAGKPFVYLFKNGKNEELNSPYRLMGRHQSGYRQGHLDDKINIDNMPAWEAELGIDLDNSNPAVQAEQLNWLYYSLFYKQIKNSSDHMFVASKDAKTNIKNSTFDDVRIDAENGIDSDVLGQVAQLMDDLYDRKSSDGAANDHLIYGEGYGPSDMINERRYFHNGGLVYDDSYYLRMNPKLEWFNDNKRPTLENAFSFINDDPTTDTSTDDKWYDDETQNIVNPNLTYSQNHDNFNGRVREIARLLKPGFEIKHFNQDKRKTMDKASAIYYSKFTTADKTYKGEQVSPKNQIALYSDMLLNKDTVPIVFYGDIFEAQENYMTKPTAIAEPIMDILNARSNYVSGGQQRRLVKDDDGNKDIITNVRFGKKYFDNKTNPDSDDFKNSRNSGIVSIFSNNSNVKKKELSVYVGKNHAGQKYRNLIDTDVSKDDTLGLTLGKAADKNYGDQIMGVPNTYSSKERMKTNNTDDIQVDSTGHLKIDVQGTNKAFVDGYLSMWVPVPDNGGQISNVYVSENDAYAMHTYKGDKAKGIKGTGLTFNSNDALDSHVLYQDFAVDIPDQGVTKDGADCYSQLAKYAKQIATSGVTDVWMAPPYISPDPRKEGQLLDWESRYGYGYMMSDRYNLGEGNTPSKYGTYKELIAATDALHNTNTAINGRRLQTMLDLVPHQIIRGDQREKVTYDQYNAEAFNTKLTLTAKNQSRYLLTKTSKNNLQYTYGGLYLKAIESQFSDIFNTPAFSTGEKLPDNERIQQWSAKYEDAYPLEFGVDNSDGKDYKETLLKTTTGYVNYDDYYLSKQD